MSFDVLTHLISMLGLIQVKDVAGHPSNILMTMLNVLHDIVLVILFSLKIT